jgi:hypothetical protein
LLDSSPTAWDVRREKTTDDVINGHAKHAIGNDCGAPGRLRERC